MATMIASVAYDRYASFEFLYELVSQDVANNRSTVNLIGRINVTGNRANWSWVRLSLHTSGLCDSEGGTSFGKGVHNLLIRQFTWDHNANGDFTNVYIGATFSVPKWSRDIGGNITLPHINRYPVLSLGTITPKLNTLSATISNQRVGTMTSYQVVQISSNSVVKSGNCNGTFTFELTGLNPNTSYSGKYKVRAYANGGWGDYMTINSNSFKTTALPTVSSTGTVDLEKETNIQFTNLNFINSWSYICKAVSTGDTIVSVNSITTNNLKVTLNASQREQLLKIYNSSNKPQVKWEITVVSNSKSYRVKTTGNADPVTTYTIPNSSTYNPDFIIDNVYDILNDKNVEISGTDKFIKLHNKLIGKIKPMRPKIDTTGKNYSISCGTKTKVLNYLDEDQSFELEDVDGDSLIITAVDSRDKSTSISIPISLIDYINPSITQSKFTRLDGTEPYGVLSLNSTYTNWKELLIDNRIMKVSYQYKKTDEDQWSNFIILEAGENLDGIFSINQQTLETNFDQTESYNLKIKIEDLLESTTIDLVLTTAFVFLWRDLKNYRLGIKKKPQYDLDIDGDMNGNALYIDGKKMLWYEDVAEAASINLNDLEDIPEAKYTEIKEEDNNEKTNV